MEHHPLYYPAPVPGFPGECRCCGGPEDGHFDGCEVGALEAVAKQLAEALTGVVLKACPGDETATGDCDGCRPAHEALAAYRALTGKP